MALEKQIGAHLPERDRIQMLKDNADKIQEYGYTKRFTPEQLARMKETLSDISIEVNDLEEQKKDAMAGFKEKLKPVITARKQLLKGLKTKSEFVQEECYKMIDHEEGRVGFYNKDGELVDVRNIWPEERQATIHNLNPKAS